MWFISALQHMPTAMARIVGSSDYPNITGNVQFYQTNYGVLVLTEIFGLPKATGKCNHSFFGFHLHDGESCSGNNSDPFADALGHYNPSECPHPYHAGDFPPLLENEGYAFQMFLTDKFMICDVIGKVVIIHSNPDDFTTQPAGNSGTKIACGQIMSLGFC